MQTWERFKDFPQYQTQTSVDACNVYHKAQEFLQAIFPSLRFCDASPQRFSQVSWLLADTGNDAIGGGDCNIAVEVEERIAAEVKAGIVVD
jgi:hypothetical protein